MTTYQTYLKARAKAERALGRFVVESLEKGTFPAARLDRDAASLIELSGVARSRKLKAHATLRTLAAC